MLYRVVGDREEREGEIEDSLAKEFSVADTFYKSILTIKIRPSYSAYTIYVHLVEPCREKGKTIVLISTNYDGLESLILHANFRGN